MTQLEIESTQVHELYERIISLYETKTKAGSKKRLIISIAGVPGSGKTTLAETLVKKLSNSIKTAMLPQDGFHLYRSELQALPNPEEAVERRGAPFTFNSKAFLELIKKLNDEKYAKKDICAPSFDHKLKDPVENDIIIESDVKIVIIEGNYVLLKDPYWSEITDYVDESWFLDTPFTITLGRLVRRHLEAGIVTTEEEAFKRANGSDMINAKYIVENSKSPDVRIFTRE